jgi:hypothetical protein
MHTALALVLLASLPLPDVAYDAVDLIELNHVYSRSGTAMYDQVVFYQWRPKSGEYQVRATRLLLRDDRPRRDFSRGDWVMIFADRGVLREVRSAAFRESWTQYDVDQIERSRLPKEYRAGLLFEKTASR